MIVRLSLPPRLIGQHRCPKCNSDAVAGGRAPSTDWLKIECGSCGHIWWRNIKDGRWSAREDRP